MFLLWRKKIIKIIPPDNAADDIIIEEEADNSAEAIKNCGQD